MTKEKIKKREETIFLWMFVFGGQKKQQKTSRFMASSKLLMTRRAVLQQLKWLINLIALQRWPAQRCQEPGTRSYRRLVNMPTGKPWRGCLIFKMARLRDGYVVEMTFSPLWMLPIVGGLWIFISPIMCWYHDVRWRSKYLQPGTFYQIDAPDFGEKYPFTTSHLNWPNFAIAR